MPLLFKQSASGNRLHGVQASRLTSVPGGAHAGSGGEHSARPRPTTHITPRGKSPSLRALSHVGGSLARRASRSHARARSSFGLFKSYCTRLLHCLKEPRIWCSLLKKAYRRLHLKHLIPLLFVGLYMLIGASLFYWLEHVLQDAIIAHQAELPEHPQEAQWSFLGAMYFAGTIFTTIGYGDIYCETVWGRTCTVVYAIVGIPLMLITLNELGKFLYKTINEWLGVDIPERVKTAKNLTTSLSVAQLGKLIGLIGDIFCPHGARQSEDVERGNLLSPSTVITDGLAPPETETEYSRRVSFRLCPEEDMVLTLDAFDDPNVKRDSTTSNDQEARIILALPPNAGVSTNANVAEQSHGGWKLLETADHKDQDSNNNLESDFEDEGYLVPPREPPPRMPVLVALGCTLSWIFVCAALFKLWEHNWSYGESIYFMFISLSTIGLGDVQVARRDLMVVCFLFVVVGLALVSMCISVIQAALEELYRTLLLKILADYQEKLAAGESHKGASIGMMKMWGGNRTAKYLMPMLSSGTRISVMHQIQEEAKRGGMEIPPIFEDIDDKSGLPRILAISHEAPESTPAALLEEIVQKTDPTNALSSIKSPSPPPNVVLYEEGVQTDAMHCDDNSTQTTGVEVDDLAIQTELSTEGEETEAANKELVDEEIQTDREPTTPLADVESQTLNCEMQDAEMMTLVATVSSLESQTDKLLSVEQALQTHLVDLIPAEAQTERTETKNERIQTPYAEFEHVETQTDPMPDEVKGPSKIGQATNRIRRAFQNRSRDAKMLSEDGRPALSQWTEHPREGDETPEETGSSYETLNWDPVDGLHAERQRPVSDLRKLFDESRVSIRRQSQRSSGSQRRKSEREVNSQKL